MGFFKRKEPREQKSSYFEGERLSEKTAQDLARSAALSGGISDSSEALAILGSLMFPMTGNSLICTDSAIVYSARGADGTKTNQYPFSSITSAVLESPVPHRSNIVLTIGGGAQVVCEVIAQKPDTHAFYNFMQEKMKKSNVSRPPISVADELLKFKQLLDAGALTKEEFEAQKRKLLG